MGAATPEALILRDIQTRIVLGFELHESFNGLQCNLNASVISCKNSTNDIVLFQFPVNSKHAID